MVIQIFGLVIGILVAGAGIYYLVREKQDKESVKIYGIISCIGALVSAGSFAALIMKIL